MRPVSLMGSGAKWLCTILTAFILACWVFSARFEVEAGELRIRALRSGETKRLVGEILDCLFDNAVQAEATAVTVDGSSDPGGARVTLTLSDNGRGLGEQDAEALFQEGVTTREGGSGIGLAHGRRLARGLGGDLVLAEAGGGGAEAALTLATNFFA